MAAIEQNSPKKRVLVAGGAGYIGTHTLIELLSAGQPVVVVDNLCNSDQEGLKRVREITGVSHVHLFATPFQKPLPLIHSSVVSFSVCS